MNVWASAEDVFVKKVEHYRKMKKTNRLRVQVGWYSKTAMRLLLNWDKSGAYAHLGFGLLVLETSRSWLRDRVKDAAAYCLAPCRRATHVRLWLGKLISNHVLVKIIPFTHPLQARQISKEGP